MYDCIMSAAQTWDPAKYAQHARFVSDLGSPVVELLDPHPDKRILDLGCGDGVLTKKLADLGCEVVAIDSSAPQVEAAKILGLTQPKLSGILRGQFRGISERKLIDCLTSLGQDVEIVVKDAPRRRAGGKLTVVFA